MNSGSVLAGKYRLISMLGSGGMGAVWRAEHLGLRAPVAVKLLAADLDGRQDAIARFLREAQSAASLRSPHVVQVLDHGVDEATQTPFIAMELMDGESLADRLNRVTRLSPAETSKLITQAARALTRAHELGIVHRDLKPANLFLVRNEDDEILKVLDFGLAKWRRAPGALTHGAATATNIVMGTPYYMSPEQMNGSRDADQRSDLWALGVIAFECLTGTRPFDGDNLISIALKVCSAPTPVLAAALALPPELDAWFSRALAKDPAQRFQTARELAEDLRRVCRAESVASASFQQPWAAEPVAPPAVPAKAETPAGLTAPLVRAPLEDPSASRPAVSDGSAAPENARSASPLSRSIGRSAPPERNVPRRRSLPWVLGAGFVVASLGGIVAVRERASSAANDVATAASPPERASAPSSLPSRSERAAQALPSASVALQELPSASAPPMSDPVVTPVPDDDGSKDARPSPPASASSPTANAPPVRVGATPRSSATAARVAPARRPTEPAPSASVKGLNIERKPGF